jgi:hypothetical protein
MDPSYSDPEDPQQLLAELEHYDEETPEWAFQPPIEPLPAHSQKGTLQLHQTSGLGLSTCFPTIAQDTVHTTLRNAFQPCQQPARMLEHNQMQDLQLSNQTQLNLTIEEIQHIEARRRFQAIRQGLPLLSDQEHIAGPYNNTTPHFYPGTDIPGDDYNRPYGISNAYMAPYQTLQSNVFPYSGSSSHGFDSDAWLTQPNPEASFRPSSSSSYAQEFDFLERAFPCLQSDDRNDSYETVSFQQPNMELMSLKPSPSNIPAPVLDVHGQSVLISCLEGTTHTGSTQTSFVRSDGSLVPADAYAPSTAFDTASNSNMTDPLIALLPPERFDKNSSPTTRSTLSDFSPLPMVGQSNTPARRTQCPVVPDLFKKRTAASKTARKRAWCGDQEVPAPHEVATKSRKTDRLQNMHVYKDPDAERAYNKFRKRTRKVTEKADWACFVCWLHKGKVCFLIAACVMCFY